MKLHRISVSPFRNHLTHDPLTFLHNPPARSPRHARLTRIIKASLSSALANVTTAESLFAARQRHSRSELDPKILSAFDSCLHFNYNHGTTREQPSAYADEDPKYLNTLKTFAFGFENSANPFHTRANYCQEGRRKVKQTTLFVRRFNNDFYTYLPWLCQCLIQSTQRARPRRLIKMQSNDPQCFARTGPPAHPPVISLEAFESEAVLRLSANQRAIFVVIGLLIGRADGS